MNEDWRKFIIFVQSSPLLVVTDGTVVMTMEQQKETDAQVLCQRRWCDISVMFDSRFVVCLIKVRRLFYVKGMKEFGSCVTVTTKRESEMGEKRKRALRTWKCYRTKWEVRQHRGIKNGWRTDAWSCQHINLWLISLPKQEQALSWPPNTSKRSARRQQ